MSVCCKFSTCGKQYIAEFPSKPLGHTQASTHVVSGTSLLVLSALGPYLIVANSKLSLKTTFTSLKAGTEHNYPLP